MGKHARTYSPEERARYAAMMSDVGEAVRTMQKGGVILYPTDTIWGLGCDAANEEAVRRIFAIKQRCEAKAMLALVDSEVKVERYVERVPEVAWQLWEVSDRPLTLILSGARNLAPSMIAPDGTVGLRITHEEFSRALCMRMKRAVVSTSANISGQPAPRTFAEISEEIKAAADYVCLSRRNESAPARPSGIIRLGADGTFSVIR